MKTNLFIAALSLVVLAGCSSEDEIDTLVSKSDNAIKPLHILIVNGLILLYNIGQMNKMRMEILVK